MDINFEELINIDFRTKKGREYKRKHGVRKISELKIKYIIKAKPPTPFKPFMIKNNNTGVMRAVGDGDLVYPGDIFIGCIHQKGDSNEL